MTEKLSQRNMLLQHFEQGKTITALEADRYPFYITQFHTRMKELRELGYQFLDWWEVNENTGSKYKRYKLLSKGDI